MVDHVLHPGQVDCDHSAQVTAPGTPCPHSARSPGGQNFTSIILLSVLEKLLFHHGNRTVSAMFSTTSSWSLFAAMSPHLDIDLTASPPNQFTSEPGIEFSSLTQHLKAISQLSVLQSKQKLHLFFLFHFIVETLKWVT